MIPADINDIRKEIWLRQRDANQIVWTTKDGTKIPLKKLSDSHLIRIYLMLAEQETAKELLTDLQDDCGEVEIEF